jgi:hypothetical protein
VENPRPQSPDHAAAEAEHELARLRGGSQGAIRSARFHPGGIGMIGRLVATAILLVLAFDAFWRGNALGAGVINPFGILFLVIAGVTWFKWIAIKEAFRSTVGLTDKIIGGMTRERRRK